METGAMMDEFLLAFAIMGASASLCYMLNLGHFSSLVILVGAACLVTYREHMAQQRAREKLRRKLGWGE
jgi:uncharacterized membrane protein YjjP (DUF1212 family)